jgi:hypothetical protein
VNDFTPWAMLAVCVIVGGGLILLIAEGLAIGSEKPKTKTKNENDQARH